MNFMQIFIIFQVVHKFKFTISIFYSSSDKRILGLITKYVNMHKIYKKAIQLYVIKIIK